ncbi:MULTISPECIES: hypothetical protein [Pseudomonas]|jgi:hypothetical protein|nr:MULTISPECIES: hypothetical protein [Pseudomonas]
MKTRQHPATTWGVLVVVKVAVQTPRPGAGLLRRKARRLAM